MKKRLLLLILFIPIILLCNFASTTASAQEKKYYLGGYPAGLALYSRGAYVVGLCDVVCEDKILSPSKNAGVLVGDVILEIDGVEVNTAKDISQCVNSSADRLLTVKRQDARILINISPAKDNLGNYKLGVFIKEGINGVGTITYFTDNEIGCLGHPVLNDNAEILNTVGGKIYKCNITAAIKGVRGRPGELRGSFLNKDVVGNLLSNNSNGVFGVYNKESFKNLKEISLGEPEMGDAYVYTTVYGDSPAKYKISIIKCDDTREDKNLVVCVTDKRLLEATNGIVQGMSGSPIVQNNKLVGAITHVFINDPTRGFGINIKNMISK